MMPSLLYIPQHCNYSTVTTTDINVIRYPLTTGHKHVSAQRNRLTCDNQTTMGFCRNLSTRHIVDNCRVTTWEDTRQNQGGKDTCVSSLVLAV